MNRSDLTSLSLLSDVVRVRHLQTEHAHLLIFDEATRAGEASRRLRSSGYDHAPTTRDGRILGRVALDRLDTTVARVGDVAEPLGVGDFIAADARLRDLLTALAAQPILFVLDGRDVSGIVTPSDLNKQAARDHGCGTTRSASR